MAIVHPVNDITMTGNTITSLCRRRRMVGTFGMTDDTISHHDREVGDMAVQASVNGVIGAVAVRIGVGDKRTRGNGLAVEQMVTVRNTRIVTSTAVSLREVGYGDIRHTDGLVDGWGGDVCPGCTGKSQRHASDSDQE